MIEVNYPYELPAVIPDEIFLGDHLGGIDRELYNPTFDALDQHAKKHSKILTVYTHNILPADVLEKRYTNLKLRVRINKNTYKCLASFLDYNTHPELDYKHFICTFNGVPHVGRKMLAAVLQRLRWFDPATCSKNFSYPVSELDGHLRDFLDPIQHRVYRKFFIDPGDEEFHNHVYSFGHVRFDHKNNIYNLEKQLTSSFLHVVSETMATSYYPFVTEKFFYSVVTRGLFLAYAQPGWHDHVERYYGFRKYDKIFDYRFDTIQNPVERLVELMSMISKFSVLSSDDWRDLYEMESETIEYNYDHYFSKRYLDWLKQC